MTTNMSTNNFDPVGVSAPSPTPDGGGARNWEGFPADLSTLPDPAVIAKLANALFAALPGHSTLPGTHLASIPPATPEVELGSLPLAPDVPLAAAFGLPSEADLRLLPAALAGATGQTPSTLVAAPAAGSTESPFYFLDVAQPTSPRTVPAFNPKLDKGHPEPFTDLGFAAPPAIPLIGTRSLPAAPAVAQVSPSVSRIAVDHRSPPAPGFIETAITPSLSAKEFSESALYFLDEVRPGIAILGAPAVESTEIRPEVLPGLASAHPAFDAYAVRRDFPILAERVHGRPLIWLDNAATTQKPQAVIDRLAYFYRHENSNIHRAAHELAARATDAYEAARDKVRRFLNAGSSDEIVFVRGSTEAINLVAQSWGRQNIGKDDEIVITWLEHHANIVPWQQLCAEKGARLRVVPVDDHGQVLLDEYQKLLGSRTRLVAFTQVSNALGTVTPAREMIEMAHRYGARVLLDGAQAVSHLRVDVQTLDCDWYVFSGHKVFAPTGIGVLFGKAELLNTMPPWQGGGNMITDVTFEKTSYQAAPSRFEAGTGNIADAVGLGAAIDYLDKIGIDNVTRYEHVLLAYAARGLGSVPGLRLIGTAPEKAGVLSFVLDGFRAEDIGTALNQEGIAVRAGHHCAQPILRRFGLESTVRASLALYNTCADIDALVTALARIQGGRGVLPARH